MSMWEMRDQKTLRDEFAMAAIPVMFQAGGGYEGSALEAYRIADALIAERARGDKAGEAQQAQDRA